MENKLSKHAAALARTSLQSFYQQLHDNGSVPPALRFCTEGELQALLKLGLLESGQIVELIDSVYRAVFSETVFADLSEQQRCIDERGHRIRLPAVMDRAPVYPTTPE